MLSRRRPVPLCGQEGAYVVVAAGQLCSVNGFARKFVGKLFHCFAPAGPRLLRLVVPAQELPNASDSPVSTTYFMSDRGVTPILLGKSLIESHGVLEQALV